MPAELPAWLQRFAQLRPPALPAPAPGRPAALPTPRPDLADQLAADELWHRMEREAALRDWPGWSRPAPSAAERARQSQNRTPDAGRSD